jgi:hypothetical protein
VPASAVLREVDKHFAVGEIGDAEYLVRPDGYVASRLSDFASVDDAVASALQGRPSGRKLARV